MLLGLSFYCNSTELRFIEEKGKVAGAVQESETMLGVAMTVVYQYLRHDIPLVGQIISVYNRAYGLSA